MKLDARVTLFMYLVGIFLTCLLIGNLIGGKLTSVELFGFRWVISVGEIPFPLTFILTDILNEFYGRKTARRVTLLGFAMTGLAIAIVRIADLPPWLPGTDPASCSADGMSPGGYSGVFLSATVIQLASMVAFLTAQYVDIGVFFVIKKATGDRMLWLRATGSTAVSQLIDTVVILTLAFGWSVDRHTLLSMIVTSYLVKVTVAILVTPLIYALHGLLERAWGLTPMPVGDGPEPGETPPA
jgi:uncharacterized integral membrane protein (TIGR00697 family)